MAGFSMFDNNNNGRRKTFIKDRNGVVSELNGNIVPDGYSIVQPVMFTDANNNSISTNMENVTVTDTRISLTDAEKLELRSLAILDPVRYNAICDQIRRAGGLKPAGENTDGMVSRNSPGAPVGPDYAGSNLERGLAQRAEALRNSEVQRQMKKAALSRAWMRDPNTSPHEWY